MSSLPPPSLPLRHRRNVHRKFSPDRPPVGDGPTVISMKRGSGKGPVGEFSGGSGSVGGREWSSARSSLYKGDARVSGVNRAVESRYRRGNPKGQNGSACCRPRRKLKVPRIFYFGTGLARRLISDPDSKRCFRIPIKMRIEIAEEVGRPTWQHQCGMNYVKRMT
ncbi:hypothetical protein NL676_022517 [Syzygium grande]|nr:hypothetical protein NL676_022517 [Syzygium grande]